MKKKPLITTVIIFAILMSINVFTGSYFNTADAKILPVDYTVTLNKSQLIDMSSKRIVSTNEPSISYLNPLPNTIEEMSKEVDIVIYGSVIKVEFLNAPDGDYGPRYKYDFFIEKSYKGKFNEGDKISVGCSGGYYTMKKVNENNKLFDEKQMNGDSENELCLFILDGSPLVEIENRYILFLMDKNIKDEYFEKLGIDGVFLQGMPGLIEEVGEFENMRGKNHRNKFEFDKADLIGNEFFDKTETFKQLKELSKK